MVAGCLAKDRNGRVQLALLQENVAVADASVCCRVHQADTLLQITYYELLCLLYCRIHREKSEEILGRIGGVDASGIVQHRKGKVATDFGELAERGDGHLKEAVVIDGVDLLCSEVILGRGRGLGNRVRFR